MPLDNPEQNDPQGDTTLDWATAPDQFRAAHDRNQARMAEIQAQLDTVTRENAARAAGIDVSTPIGQMFMDGYKGDATPDAMRTAFEALGVPTATPEQPPAPEVNADEREFERLRNVVQGQATPPGEEPAGDIWLGSGGVFPTFHDAIKRGMRRDDAGALAIEVLFEAAMNPTHPQHDQAIWNRDRWLESQGR